MDKTLEGKLVEIVGVGNVIFDARARERYSSDATGCGGLADAVALPRDAEQVARLVRLAYEDALAVTPRGAGTGLRGGAVPASGGIVISTERMNRPPVVHGDDLYAVAEPGVTVADLERAVARTGLYYPIDPAGGSRSTVGGNIADAARGFRTLKYGTVRHYVLGLDIVTPEGKTVKTGAKMVKSVAGYDATRLFVGSQGTLGIITSATLKVIPAPQARRTFLFTFPDSRLACEKAAAITAERLTPSAMEVMDETATEISSASGLVPTGSAVLLVEVDGAKSACDEDASKIGELAGDRRGNAQEVGGDRCARVWEARRNMLATILGKCPAVILESVETASGSLPRMLDEVRSISARHGAAVACFGHAGEATMHLAIMLRSKDEAAVRRGREVQSALRGACVGAGGSVADEHNIGTGAASFSRLSLNDAGFGTMKRLKLALDPKAIMNPGKMFYEA